MTGDLLGESDAILCHWSIKVGRSVLRDMLWTGGIRPEVGEGDEWEVISATFLLVFCGSQEVGQERRS